MLYGQELIESLKREIQRSKEAIDSRFERIDAGWTDMDDCFISQKCDERAITTAERKIALIEEGGCAWFQEYATLGGQLVNAKWVNTKYGCKLRVELPDGSVKWTVAETAKGLAQVGIKKVLCKRPAWYCFRSGNTGMLGVYTGSYVLFPSDVNYATGESATVEPIEMKDFD